MSTPSSHNAFVVHGPHKFSVDTIPTPAREPGEVLVKVGYAALIPFDVEISYDGHVPPNMDFPYIPGFNLTGTVVDVGTGDDCRGFKVGDVVSGFALPSYGNKAKVAQEYSVIPAVALTKLSPTASLAEAATIPDNFACAWWTIFEYLKIPLSYPLSTEARSTIASSSFLIYGASSTTGQFMLQVLKWAGARSVYAIASSTHHDRLKSIGASHTFDYKSSDWPQQVLDANGGHPVRYAIDIIATDVSLKGVSQCVNGAQADVAVLLPIKIGHEGIISKDKDAKLVWELPPEHNPFAQDVEVRFVRTFLYNKNEELRDRLLPDILRKMLEEEAVTPTAMLLLDDMNVGLDDRVKEAFEVLHTNGGGGRKVIVKVQDL